MFGDFGEVGYAEPGNLVEALSSGAAADSVDVVASGDDVVEQLGMLLVELVEPWVDEADPVPAGLRATVTTSRSVPS